MTHSHDVMHWLQTPREYLESEADVSVVVLVVVAAASGVERRSRALKMFLEKWSLSTSAFSLSSSSSSSYSSSTSRASLSELASQELSRFAVDSCDICKLFVAAAVLGISGVKLVRATWSCSGEIAAFLFLFAPRVTTLALG